jgi:hypothetical protein
MAYDAARGQVVLFGGYLMNDTWTWDGTDLTQRFPAHSPPARQLMGMAYDSTNGRVLMFGGTDGGGDDTWTWDGTDWTQRLPRTFNIPDSGTPCRTTRDGGVPCSAGSTTAPSVTRGPERNRLPSGSRARRRCGTAWG